MKEFAKKDAFLLHMHRFTHNSLTLYILEKCTTKANKVSIASFLPLLGEMVNGRKHEALKEFLC